MESTLFTTINASDEANIYGGNRPKQKSKRPVKNTVIINQISYINGNGNNVTQELYDFAINANSGTQQGVAVIGYN